MRAVRLQAPGQELRTEEVPIPEPTGTEIRIRVAGCGVCHTDLHIVDGTQTRVALPVTLGHEVAGWVDAVGPDADGAHAIDSPVLVHGGWGCGDCRDCRAGAEQRCVLSVAPGFQADGGYADAMLVPHPRHLVPLGSLDPVRAAPLADAGVTPYRAVRRAERWLDPMPTSDHNGRWTTQDLRSLSGSYATFSERYASSPSAGDWLSDMSSSKSSAIGKPGQQLGPSVLAMCYATTGEAVGLDEMAAAIIFDAVANGGLRSR